MLTEEKRKQGEEAVRKLLSCFNVDIDKREGMEETPKRVIKMLEEVWAYEGVSNTEIAKKFGKVFSTDDTEDLVVVKDIECFSYCEHHLALIYDMKVSVAYLPWNNRVIGLSKIARIVEACCSRLQLQERIGADIVDVMQRIVGYNVIVKIEAKHSCMTARGIKNTGAKTTTVSTGGIFKEDMQYRQDALALM